MKHQETLVVGGVDAHADSHHAAALDERGALLGTEGFATTTDGYGELAGSVLRLGSKNGQVVRHAPRAPRGPARLNRSGPHFRERAAPFRRRLYATASRGWSTLGAAPTGCRNGRPARVRRGREGTLACLVGAGVCSRLLSMAYADPRSLPAGSLRPARAAKPTPHLFPRCRAAFDAARPLHAEASVDPARRNHPPGFLAADGRSLRPRACCSRGSSSAQARRGRAC